MPMPIISIDDFMKNATKEQSNLLSKLMETAAKENELRSEVDLIYESIKLGFYVQEGCAPIPCESEDDAAIISGKKRTELESVKGQMKSHLIDAVKMGMGNLGIIQRTYETYVGKPLPEN